MFWRVVDVGLLESRIFYESQQDLGGCQGMVIVVLEVNDLFFEYVYVCVRVLYLMFRGRMMFGLVLGMVLVFC